VGAAFGAKKMDVAGKEVTLGIWVSSIHLVELFDLFLNRILQDKVCRA
jgi:hypothetical protein